ncbi:hypothetical protein CHAB381_0784 [Campylobacter hominis ATCC BAA-381]|uniref:Uncharacterized protein n=1 Tax=Campylobacter hominis (strain ATCC BAA-381 / DSM 21671 / CCUG 45161 / LMG 19568 / NCTC 13146 / CH001A) TaxID=360107 RepID=A7I1G7_CAMHC|nr:hypothetical protein CHAB381_0784 [Campylobacter hominis ATCC BAA-381]
MFNLAFSSSDLINILIYFICFKFNVKLYFLPLNLFKFLSD